MDIKTLILTAHSKTRATLKHVCVDMPKYTMKNSKNYSHDCDTNNML